MPRCCPICPGVRSWLITSSNTPKNKIAADQITMGSASYAPASREDGSEVEPNHAQRLLYFGLSLSSSLHNTFLEHFGCLTEEWYHITLPVSQRQRINEKALIPPFCPSGVYCIGISRALDCHRSLQKFFHGPIDDHSS